MLQRDIQSRNEFPGAAEYGNKFIGVMNRMSVKYTVAESTGELFKSFDKRLASFLLEEMALESSSVLRMTHEAIGNHLGNPREVVTRMLRYFQGEGAVKLTRGSITVTDVKRLREISQA